MSGVHHGCLVCNEHTAKVVASSAGGSFQVTCSYCGNYSITSSALFTLQNNPLTLSQVVNARGWIRENQSIMLHSDDLDRLKTLKSPTVAERADKLLLALSKESKHIGGVFEISHQEAPNAKWIAYSWSENVQEVRYLLLQYMTATKGWLSNLVPQGLTAVIQIAAVGYDRLEALRFGDVKRVTGFCAMWFADEMTPVWGDAIRPGITASGYEPLRIDGVEHNNKIDDEILSNIRASRFVVADFTGERGGVYFEAGFALGLGIPVIWTVRDDALSKVHFDNRQYNFIVWKPEDLPDFARRLQLRIEATIGRGPINP